MGNSFVAFDFETANSHRGSACEIGMVRVVDGTPEAWMESLIRPHAGHREFDFINTSLHGIGEQDVEDAPEFDAVWVEARDFIGDLPLVAHNASFDIRILRELFQLYSLPPVSLSYFCTLVLSRKALDLVSYSLPFVAKVLDVNLESHHRAALDALATAEIATKLVLRSGLNNLAELADSLRVTEGRFSGEVLVSSKSKGQNSNGWTFNAARIEEIRSSLGEAAEKADPDGPLFDKRVAFTGGLASLTRAEAAARVLAAGGEPQATVNKHTNFLVVGAENGYTIDPHTAITAKFAKAEALRAKGSEIEILDELTFIRML